mmetsp:Transcript_3709/g.7819  ORF Transcript_3709/g.7819 Transcript_3709/m.7819 type:complete len:222 (+) Transcript_3709:581-1246(+)
MEEGRGVVRLEVVHVHPPLERAAHRVQHEKARPNGLEACEAVDHLQLHRVVALVGVSHAAYERGERLVGRGEVHDVGAHTAHRVRLLDLHLVVADEHIAASRGRLVGVGLREERLRLEGLARRALALEQRAEPDEGGDLVRLLRRLEQQDAAVLALHAEGGEPLPAVHVEGPHGNPPQPADAGEEAGHRLDAVERPHDIPTRLVEHARVLLRRENRGCSEV